MNYLQYTFQTAPENVDLLIAFLSDSPFDTFEETPDGFLAFAPASADEADIEAHLAELQEQFSFSFQKSLIEGQNWNELWESNFDRLS